MSTQLDVGRVCAVSVDHHWTLEGRVSVQLRPHDTTRFLSLDNLISRIKSHSLWISRANGLNLTVHFNHCDSVKQHSTCPSAQRLFLALRSAIVDAELWKQLELDVDLLDSTADPSRADDSTFVLGVRHSSELRHEKVKRLHRLNVGESAADLRPPAAMEVLELERIFILLNLRHDEEEEEEEEEKEIVKEDCNGSRRIRHDEAAQCDAGMLDQNDEEMLDAPDSMVLVTSELSPLLLDEASIASIEPRSSQIIEIARATPLLSQPTSPISIPTALDLLDATFRSAICQKPKKLPLGVWLPQPTNDLSLSALAPSLLCPGYAKAVAERACFLPTVTHALSSSLLRHARSTTLRRKLEELRLDNGREDDSNTGTSLSEIIKAKLWRTIQRGVYRGDAARCLKPLRAPSQDLDSGPRQEDDDDDAMMQPKLSELVTVPLRARKAEATRLQLPISTISPGSPILLGRLSVPQNHDWDGGLLGQPVNSDLFRRMLYAPETQRLSSHFDKRAGDLVEDANSMLDDAEYDEYDSILDDDDDDENSIPDDNLLDDGCDGNNSILFGSVIEQGDDDEDDFMYPPSPPTSTILQDSNPNPSSRFERIENDTLILPKYSVTQHLQECQNPLLRDDSSSLADSDILLQDAEDSDIPFSSQESSLTAMTVYSDNDSTAKYFNLADSSSYPRSLPLPRKVGEALSRTLGDYREYNLDEDMRTDTIDNNDNNQQEAWQQNRGEEDECQDEDMLGANFLKDSDEEMLAF